MCGVVFGDYSSSAPPQYWTQHTRAYKRIYTKQNKTKQKNDRLVTTTLIMEYVLSQAAVARSFTFYFATLIGRPSNFFLVRYIY